jgi:hypothetical protein
MENDSDIFMQNVTQEIYEKDVRNFLEDTTGEDSNCTFRSAIFVFVYDYPLGILYIYFVRTVMRTSMF